MKQTCHVSWVMLSVLALSTAHAQPARDGVVAVPAPSPATAAPEAGAPDPNNPGDQLFFMVQLAGKKGRRVIRELRVLERDVPALVAATRKTLPDGTEDLYIAYDVSLFNQCVFDQDPSGREATRAAREACVGARGIETKLAHVTVAPTPRGRTEDNGGAIEVVADISLGTRASDGRDLYEQTFFLGLGLAPITGTTRMRVWVTKVHASYEEAYGARAEPMPGTYHASYGTSLTFFDAELAEVDVLHLGGGEDEATVSMLNRPTFPIPTIAYADARRRLDVHVAERRIAFVYDPAHDAFDDVPTPTR
jgi:hypothetical protein